MEHHGHCLASFRTQHDFGAADFGIVAHGIRRELAPNELCQRYSLPQTGTQQLVRCCHRANPSLKRIYESADRSASLAGVGDDSANRRERILDSMVKFGIQDLVGVLASLALGDVDVDAGHPLWAPIPIVRDET